MQKGKIIFRILKIAAILASISYVVYKLRIEHQTGLNVTFPNWGSTEFMLLGFSFFLVPLNWLIEAYKFQYLVKPLQPLKLADSIKGVLSGVTVSIFTPKRVGDFGGRVFVLETPNRIKGVFATLLGSLSQLLITLIMGILFLNSFFLITTQFSQGFYNSMLGFFLLLGLVVPMLAFYFNISTIGRWLVGFKYFERHEQAFSFIYNYNRRQLLLFLGFSLLRYGVFTLQFFMLLLAFGGEINYLMAIKGISMVYLIMAVMPTFALDEIGVRGSVAVWALAFLNLSPSIVLTASTFLWIINLAIPAMVGTYFLLKLKY